MAGLILSLDDLLIIMKAIDTCHDFKGGKRGAENINVDDALNAIIGLFFNTSIESGSDILLGQYKGTTETRLEPRFAEYLETAHSDRFVPIEKEYTLIDGDDKGNKINLENYLGLKSFRIILNKIDPLTNNLNYIGEFIHKFMFGTGPDPDPGSDSIGFVIDANSGKLPLFFVDNEKVNTYVNALVMADSAGTGENEKTTSNFYFRRTPFVFPAVIDPPNTKKFSIKDCLLFSNDFITLLYYEEIEKNSFATDFKSFKLVVGYEYSTVPSASEPSVKKQTQIEASFAPTNKQGPTINTLSKLIQTIYSNKDSNTINKDSNTIKEILCDNNFGYPSSEMDIRPVIYDMLNKNVPLKNIIAFLFDFKRTGDYGQVNSAVFMSMSKTPLYSGGKKIDDDKKRINQETVTNNIIVSTGDQLCCAYSRYREQCCIYNHHNINGHYIDLYRGPKQEIMTIGGYIKLFTAKKEKYETYLNFYKRCHMFNYYMMKFNEIVYEFISTFSQEKIFFFNYNKL